MEILGHLLEGEQDGLELALFKHLGMSSEQESKVQERRRSGCRSRREGEQESRRVGVGEKEIRRVGVGEKESRRAGE